MKRPARHPLRPLAIASLIALTVPCISQAQQVPTSTNPYLGANITRVYTIDELTNRPGLLTLGKGDMIYLDFYNDVDVIVTPQSPMMDIPEPLGNLVVITGKVNSGTALMGVRLTNGRLANFIINFVPGTTTMKRIQVTDTSKVDYAQPVVQTPVASNAMPGYVAPNMAGAASNGQYDLTRFIPTSTSTPLNRTQPAWLSTYASASGNTLSISISNGGPRDLTLSNKDLQVTVEGRNVDVNLSQDLTVAAGKTQVITLPLNADVSPGADVSARWLAFDAAANTYYQINALRK